MKKIATWLLAVCMVCTGFTSCQFPFDIDGITSQTESVENTQSQNGGNQDEWISGENKTAFSEEEQGRFNSAVGFVIPYIQNWRYRIEDYEGYNGDLMAYENGMLFVVEGLTEEACDQYIEGLKNNEDYSFEYPQDGYYYFSRFVGDEAYFVKVRDVWMKTHFGLEVYAYSYTFEEIDSGDSGSDSSVVDSEEEPDLPTTGFKFEKLGQDSYEIVGFYGDEDGVVEIPESYNGLPVRNIAGNAFYGQESITEVIIGDNIYAIEGNAFMLCCNLEKVTLGNNLTVIDQSVFLGCEKLEEITIPASVTFMGASVFKNCTNLKSVVLEDPEGWYNTNNLYKIFPVEDMSNASTVATYFTETYVSQGWFRD